MFDSLLKVLHAGLSLWADKEKTKYIDQLRKLERDYREEYNKPIGVRSDAVLDHLEFELRILGDTFAASIGRPDTKNQH